LLRTPEARALAGLVRDKDPAVVVVLREYGPTPAQGADVVLRYASERGVRRFIARAAHEWFGFGRPLQDALAREGLRAGYADARGPGASGNVPGTELNVAGLRNAVSLMVTMAAPGSVAVDAARRVRAQLGAIRSVVASAAARAQDLVKLRHHEPAEFGSMPMEPSGSRLKRPCGYWLAADASAAAGRLRQLGVQVEQVRTATGVLGALYRERQPRAGMPKQIELIDALIDMPPGSYFVSLAQPLANIAVAALEPDTECGYYAHRIVGHLDQVARLRTLPKLVETEAQSGGTSEPPR
jgi:hypothetical protein